VTSTRWYSGPRPHRAVPRAVPGWWRIGFDAATRQVLLPRGVRLDLGSTAKAFAADRAAGELAASLGCGVLVNLGGDIAVAGPAPAGGWRVRVCEAHDAPADLSAPIVSIRSGGLATSSTTRRAWRQGDREVHHIVDPRTGDIARRCWRTATVAAGSCVDANTASTAAIVLCADAVSWLGSRGLPARLVGWCGEVTTVAGWPCEEEAAQ
jgi:thiamine biosynthesis lipoprotein